MSHSSPTRGRTGPFRSTCDLLGSRRADHTWATGDVVPGRLPRPAVRSWCAGAQPWPAAAQSPAVHPLVGAYYYLWNPENFAGGTLRAHLDPPQVPASSLVELPEPADGRPGHHERRQAGINFFAIDWWPYDAGYSGADYRTADKAMKDFLAAPNISQMRFAMFYETWNLGLRPWERVHAGHVPDGAALRLGHGRLRQALLPQSLLPADPRATRRLLVPDPDPDRRCRRHDQGARTVLKAKGFNPFFIGDEVYWRVTPENPSPAGPSDDDAAGARIEQFDAMTSYILYYGDPELLPRADPGLHRVPRHDRHRGRRTASPRRVQPRRPPDGCRSSPISRRASTIAASGSRRIIRRNRANGSPGRDPPRRSTISSAASRCPRRSRPADGHGDVVGRLERGHRD